MKEFISKFDYVLFKKQIEKIKNNSLKKYFIVLFSLKTISIKILMFVFVVLFSSLLFFLLRESALNNANIEPVFNKGVGFGIFNNSPQSLIYFIKIFISILFLILFVVFNKWYYCLVCCLIGVNGMLNVIDKLIVDYWISLPNIPNYDSVVDYINFNTSIANVADVLITIGFCSLFIATIFDIVYQYIKETKKQKHENSVNEENCS